MELCLIWAQAHNRAIGRDNTLPWSAPADLRHFKETTLGSPVLMGRRTWESLPRRPLPGRQNLVLSSTPVDGAVRVASLQEGITMAGTSRPNRLFVIGGQTVYEKAIRIADTLFVTQVDVEVAGADAFAPVIDSRLFELASRSNVVPGEPALVFEVYKRRRY